LRRQDERRSIRLIFPGTEARMTTGTRTLVKAVEHATAQ
jgi:hypothetical protein